jgi:hypothetical protein
MVFLLSFPVHGLVDFYGYQTATVRNDTIIDGQRVARDVTRYNQRLMGYSELETTEISVVPRGMYLDITEDSWISSDVNQLNIAGMTGDYLYKGTLPIPQNATVTGLQTWRGERMYRARLKESKYLYDAQFADSSSLQQSLDSKIALLQQHTETTFEITLARVGLGETIHVRIRYLLKPGATQTGQYSIPVLFDTRYGKKPQFISLTVYADAADQKYKLTSSTGTYPLEDTVTMLVPYEPAVGLQHAIPRTSSLNLTAFTAGSYSGNYLAINTKVTDSTVIRLSKPISTVFIWRWNGPAPMITTENQIKTLSPFAWQIIGQAKQLRSAMEALHRLGNACALIHSIEGSDSYAFKSRSINSLADSSAISYLKSINETALFENYRKAPDATPDWAVQENGNTTVIQHARDEFLGILSEAQTMLRNDPKKDFRHIVLVTIGGTEDSYHKDLHDQVTLDGDSISIDPDNSIWRGVDIAATLPPRNSLYQWSEYRFPAFSPVTIQLTIRNAAQPFSFPLNKNTWQQAMTFTARTLADWDTVLTWTGFDATGKPTKTIDEHPCVFSCFADSALAKLWAGDNNHIAEKEEVFPGGTFGILTKATYLQATSANIADETDRTVPFLSDEEILAPRSATIRKQTSPKAPAMIACIINGDLHLKTPGQPSGLRIFDLQGKVLLDISIERYRTSDGGFTVPLSRLLKKKSLHTLVIQLYSNNCRQTIRLINGRIQ